VSGDAEWQRQGADDVPQDQHGDDGRRDREVRLHDPVGAPRQINGSGQRLQIVADQDRVGGFHRQVGALDTHGDAGVGGGHRRGVVDAVTDEQHPVSLTEGVDVGDLVVWQQTGLDAVDPHLGAESSGRLCVVPGEQDGLGAGQHSEAGHRLLRPFPDLVGQADHPDRVPVNGDYDRRVAGALESGDHTARREGGLRFENGR
jgi:hypothetical protein